MRAVKRRGIGTAPEIRNLGSCCVATFTVVDLGGALDAYVPPFK